MGLKEFLWGHLLVQQVVKIELPEKGLPLELMEGLQPLLGNLAKQLANHLPGWLRKALGKVIVGFSNQLLHLHMVIAGLHGIP